MNSGSVVIVGAGVAGLSLGNLLLTRGLKNVTIIESHSLPGGCAGFYRRGLYQFDVGATTISGLKPGRPVHTFLEKTNIQMNFHHENPGMIFHGPWGKIPRHIEIKKWINELEKFFPHVDHNFFWNKLDELSEGSWKLFSSINHFPPRSVSDLFKQIDSKILDKMMNSYYLINGIDVIDKSYLKNIELKQLLDQLLLISTQNTTEKAPALIAALGAMYPEDTYYPEGGIGGFSSKLLKEFRNKGGKAIFNSKVLKIAKHNQKFLVHTRGDKSFEADKIVLSIPVWNIANLFENEEKEFFTEEASGFKFAWGALTVYGVVKKHQIENLYHQVHTEADKSLFFSFSKWGDKWRSPDQEQVFSVSQHVEPDSFPNKSNFELYNSEKEKFRATVIKALVDNLGIEESSIEIDSVATPSTFLHYTNRFNGFVGGIPHQKGLSLFKFPSIKTPFKNIYRIGDTVFPGQGIVGVIGGALMAEEIIDL